MVKTVAEMINLLVSKEVRVVHGFAKQCTAAFILDKYIARNCGTLGSALDSDDWEYHQLVLQKVGIPFNRPITVEIFVDIVNETKSPTYQERVSVEIKKAKISKRSKDVGVEYNDIAVDNVAVVLQGIYSAKRQAVIQKNMADEQEMRVKLERLMEQNAAAVEKVDNEYGCISSYEPPSEVQIATLCWNAYCEDRATRREEAQQLTAARAERAVELFRQSILQKHRMQVLSSVASKRSILDMGELIVRDFRDQGLKKKAKRLERDIGFAKGLDSYTVAPPAPQGDDESEVDRESDGGKDDDDESAGSHVSVEYAVD